MLRRARAIGLAVVGCALVPGAAQAQPGAGIGHYRYPHTHYPHGPRVAPEWSYPGLAGGPYVGYPPPGAPGYPAWGYPHGFLSDSGHAHSLHRPPVPVYGPLPEVFPGEKLHRHWRSTLAPGFAGYGFFGIYTAVPRPTPRTVSVYPGGDEVSRAPGAGGGCLTLSVKVPDPAAEILVDGKKTAQTGTDRTFESPPLEAGKGYTYTLTARWIERGQPVEVSKVVSGAPGETVKVDFSTPAVAGK